MIFDLVGLRWNSLAHTDNFGKLTLQAFDEEKLPSPRGFRLIQIPMFVEGEAARGIYILRSGRATSSIS